KPARYVNASAAMRGPAGELISSSKRTWSAFHAFTRNCQTAPSAWCVKTASRCNGTAVRTMLLFWMSRCRWWSRRRLRLPNNHLATFKTRFDFHGNAAGKRRHADGAARALARLRAEYFHHQVAEAVDDFGMLSEILRGMHHAEGFYQSLDLVETAEFLFD